MLNLIHASVLIASLMGEPDPCYDVVERAKSLSGPDQQLSLLGGCLASRNTVFVHAAVAIEMAKIANEHGMPEEVDRYLELLETMIEGIYLDSVDSQPEQ
ncbi:MAG: hypothetical protein E8F57_00450 [Methylophaga nitratireducenticrescens]|uniref:hypothetical protein n=1 Tax=Methylophaga sp. SB9B TaxID=2570356 RepID=UPI0010A75590|nr:hypothetical protein [Methylophaga sp. SB9B]THF72605.1 MAG: hypothetical protein E8F57_00450 [Methylophaga nitratireducenticrescens]THK41976.1 hypothetical protein E8Q33_03970 [Methylophaga sp. SB9B]